MKLILRFIIFVTFLNQVYGAPLAYLPPSQDPFYTPPENWEASSPGDILRSRVGPQLRGLLGPINVQNVWQILVRTSDQFGNATTMVSTILEPYNANSSKVVSYQIAEDSSNGDCAISYVLTYSANYLQNIINEAETIFIQTILEATGAYVILPDYEAAISSWLPTHQEGYATLDSVRAVLKSGNFTNISENAKVGLVGYSGAGLASSWAASLQPSYAPELKANLVGAAVGGVVLNYTAFFELIEGGVYSGFTGIGLAGISKTYPNFQSILNDQVSATNQKRLQYAFNYCELPSLIYYMGIRFFTGATSWVKSGFQFFSIPEIKTIIDYNTLAFNSSSPMPEIPIFLYHGKLDATVPYDDVVRVYNNWCAQGISSLEFNTDLSAEHIIGIFSSAPAVVKWIGDRLESVPAIQGCQSTSRLSNLLYPGISPALVAEFSAAFASVFGSPIGPTTSISTNQVENLLKISNATLQVGFE